MYTSTAAVVGVGFIGPVHVEGLRRLGIRVKGVLDYSPEKSEEARAAMGLEKAYASLEEILEDGEVDAVHLAVPNVLHHPMAKKCLAAGKHVMCEKPLGMDTTETEELKALAAGSGLLAGVNYNLRYYPLNLEARQRIQSGELGQIFSVVGAYVQDWLLYDTDYNWRVLADQGGALRAVADIGTHWMDLVTSMTGLEVDSVFADLNTVYPIRKRPVGEVETFSGKAGDAPQEAYEEVAHNDTEDCWLASSSALPTEAPKASTAGSLRSRPGRKNRLPLPDRRFSKQVPRLELRAAPMSCGSASATEASKRVAQGPRFPARFRGALCQLSRRSQRGLSRYLQAVLPGLL
jgi:predicted dehydrogenase